MSRPIISIQLTTVSLLQRLLVHACRGEFVLTLKRRGIDSQVMLQLHSPAGWTFLAPAQTLWSLQHPGGRSRSCFRINSSHLPDYRDWIVTTLSEVQRRKETTLEPAPRCRRGGGETGFSRISDDSCELSDDAAQRAVTALFDEPEPERNTVPTIADRRMPDRGDLIGGNYICQEEIGRTSESILYRVSTPTLSRPLTLTLYSEESDVHQIGDHFLDEAQQIAGLETCHVPTVCDFGIDAHFGPYLVMEHLKGHSLATELAAYNGGLDLERFFALTIALLAALDSLHRHGVVHGNLKPNNIWICSETNLAGTREFIKLFDLGTPRNRAEGGLHRTSVWGSPTYMAPEQIQGETASERTDLYALGVVLFEMLTGRPPFDHASADAVLISHLTIPPRPLAVVRNSPLDSRLEQLVMSLLKKNPGERGQSVLHVYQTLRAQCA